MSNLTVSNQPTDSINTIELSGNTLIHNGVTYKQLFGKITVDKNMNRYIDAKNQLNISLKTTPTFKNVKIDSTDFNEDKYAATVGYVKENLNKLDAKDSVVVATTQNIESLSGLLTVDGVTLAVNNRVLVKDQSDKKQNGIYIVASGAWARSADFANASKQQGSYVYVEGGNTHKNKGFMLTGTQKTIGTNELEFAQFNGAPAFEPGTGLTRDGNTLNLIDSLNNVTEMTGLIAVGKDGVSTTFSGPIVASQGLNGDVSGNAATATALQTPLTIGGVYFDGTANIDLSGVSQTGNQDTTGNAATATALKTPITIGDVSFDGTSPIDLPGVNVEGTQDTTGNAATASAAKPDSDLASKISKLNNEGNLTGDVSGNVTGNLTGNVTGDVTGNVDGIVGGNTPAAITGTTITGTTITANTSFSGDLTGNVTGNLTGTVLTASQGSITTMSGLTAAGSTSIQTTFSGPIVANEGVTVATGNLTGNVIGDLSGNVTGDVTGNLTGNVVGDVSGNLTASIIKITGIDTGTDSGIPGQLWVDSSGYVRMS